MPYENLIYEARDQVVYITLNRPERRNALSEALMKDLDAAVEEADTDDEIKVLVIKGAGNAFCAGYDIAGRPGQAPEFRPDGASWRSLDRSVYRLRRNGEWWMKLLWNMRKPVIAQVHGYCLAGGLDLAGCCDLVFAAEDAQFGMPQARALGIPHTFGLLPLLIGMRKTKEMAFTGDTISGIEAERLGVINKAVPIEELEAEATRWAERIALMPAELLAANKMGVNRFFEIMGIDTMVKASNEFDAIGRQNQRNFEFRRIVSEEGLRAGLTYRDGPWDDYASGSGRKPRA